MEAMGQIEIQMVEMHNLIQKLDQTVDLTKKRNTAPDITKKRHNKLLEGTECGGTK